MGGKKVSDSELCTCGENTGYNEVAPVLIVYEPHGCPFAEEVHDNYEFQCTCCPLCTYECSMDI